MPSKIFHLKQWTPQVVNTAQDIISEIKKIAPELEVLFMGAAALGLPGKNDIGLDILCDIKDLIKYTDLLKAVLGEPKEMTDKLTTWDFIKNGFEVDCILSDPRYSHVPVQRRRFEVFKSNPELLEEYKQLKLSCDGLPYDEYEKRKLEFFDKVYKQ